jgi:hypothetical protein
MERVAGQRRVVRLDIEAVLAVEAVADEEPVDRRRVVVVLMLRRLHRLGLDKERALEADPVLVLGDQMEEAGELVAFAPKVSVEQRVVTLATAPQGVVRAAEPLGDLEHVLDLGRGVGEHLGIRVGRRAALVAGVGEQVGRAPQQLRSGALLVAQRLVGQCVEIGPELGVGVAFRGHVAVVEAVIRHAELLEEFEGDGQLLAGLRHRVAADLQPRPVQRPDPEHVAAVPGERMPQADADPEVVGHRLAEDEPIRPVDLECKGVAGPQALEPDRFSHITEKRPAHANLLSRKPVAASSVPRACLDLAPG